MKTLIEYIFQIIEKQRAKSGFSFKEMDDLPTLKEKFDYLESHLEFMGKGSSRVAFILTTKRVVKLAINMAGIEQNKAEFEAYSKAGNKNAYAKVYQHDPKFNWIVSELVNPIRHENEFYKKYGFSPETILFFVRRNPSSVEELDKVIKNTIKNYEALLAGENTDEGLHNILTKNIERYQSLLKQQQLKELIVELATKRVDVSDLTTPGHWGKTADGRLVILDYGLNDEIWSKYYTSDGKRVQLGNFDDQTQKITPKDI
jgi:hypothetical protein